MMEKLLLDIEALISQSVCDRKKEIQSHPDVEPFIEFDNSEITQYNYPDIFKEFTFVDKRNKHQISFIKCLSSNVQLLIKEIFPLTNDGYQYQEIKITNNGVMLLGLNDIYVLGSPQFMLAVKTVSQGNTFCFEGEQAQTFYDSCNELFENFMAEMLALEAHRTPQILFNIRERYPKYFDSPCLQKALAAVFKNNNLHAPKAKPGKAIELTQNIIDLYSKVHEYRELGKTLEQACGDAIDTFPQLIPKTWTNPDDALKRLVIRLDKSSPLISIKKSINFNIDTHSRP